MHERTFGAGQCILLIQEIFFNYLIAILLVKIESDEIASKIEFLLKNIDFFLKIFEIFENEPIMQTN